MCVRIGDFPMMLLAALVAIFGLPAVGLESSASAQTSASHQSDATQSGSTQHVIAPGGAAADRPAAGQGARRDPRGRGKSRKRRTRSRSKRRQRRSRRSRASNQITVPVDLGIGPAFFLFGNPLSGGQDVLNGPIHADQTVHYGLRLDLAAIIDYEFLKSHQDMVPSKYRGMIKPGNEVRYTPSILALIPRDIIISPKTNNTGVYGATWEFLHIGIDLLKSSRATLGLGAGLIGTYAYIYSDAFPSPTHFLRPGASVGVNLGVMLSDAFGISAGWDSNFYIPQGIGGGIFEIGDDADHSLWHIGEAFVMLHFRFPYTTTL